MVRRSRVVLLLLAVSIVPAASLAVADDAEGPRYARAVSEDERLALDIEVRELIPPHEKGPRVWLVGVVHIADASYYEAVQSVLDLHPVVLYESVMPPGAGRLRSDTADARVEDTRIRLTFLARLLGRAFPRGGDLPRDLDGLVAAAAKLDPRLGHFVDRARLDAWGGAIRYEAPSVTELRPRWNLVSLGSDGEPGGEGEAADLEIGFGDELDVPEAMKKAPFSLQEQFAKLLGLAYQGGSIDYDRPRWRPSDMGIDQVRRAVKARGGDFEGVEEVLAGRGLTGTLVRLYLGILRVANALTGGQVATAVKAVLIRQLGEGPAEPEPNAVLDEAVLGAIIHDRNAVVIEDLKSLVAEQPDLPSVAIFYGAGHMPGIESCLEALGYEPGRTQWLRAMEVDTAKAGAFAEAVRRRLEEAAEGR